MNTAVANFIEALLVHYPVRHDSEEREDAWVNSITGALRGYSGKLLDQVATDIVRTRKYRNFPLLSEILDKCEEVEKRQRFEERERTLPAFQQVSNEWSTERCRLAYDLIKSGLGKEAARDNPCWILALWHFCRQHQRLPAGSEIERCKKSSSGFDAAYRECVKGGWPQAKMLESLGANMLAKREKMRAEVLGQ